MTQIELDALHTICSNIPMLNDIANDIAKQLKIKNKIDLLRLKKDNGYEVECSDIDKVIAELDKT